MNYLFLSAYFGFITDVALKKQLLLQKYPHIAFLSVLTCFAFLTAFDSPIRIVKGCLFIQLLIYAGYRDQRTREIPDWLPICVALCGLINFNPADSLLGALAVFTVLMIPTLLFDSFGGGDIKLLTACGFTLGIPGAMIASVLSLSLFSIVHLNKSHRSSRYPLAPFIAVGCFLTFCFL